MSLGSALPPPPVYALDSDDDDDNVKNRSISELISTLRTAYRTSDFDRVEEILVAKEAKLKKEMEKTKTENALLYSQCEVGKLDKITLEEELSRHKTENEELKKMLCLIDDDRKAKQEREEKAEGRYEKLLEEVKKGGQEDKMVICELRSKNSELESAKLRIERDLAVWRERFRELDNRVLRLEEDTTMLRNARPQVSKNNEKEGLSGNGGVENENNVGKYSVAEKIEANVFDCDQNTRVAVGAGLRSPVKGDGDLQNAASGRFASAAIVDINDSSDDDCALARRNSCAKETNIQKLADNMHSGPTGMENGTKMLKRKRASCANINENVRDNDHEEEVDLSPTSIQNMKQHQESIHKPDNSALNHCSATAVSSGGNSVEKLIIPSKQDSVLFGQCQEKMKTEKYSQNFMHPLILDEDSDDSSSSSDSDDDVDVAFYFGQSIPKV